jgi:ABC-type nitrate/sulfonate/bicarbonate transport system substrate-binding protein
MGVWIHARRWLAVCLGLTLTVALAACGSSANMESKSGSKQLQQIRLQLNWEPDSEFSSIFMADAKGYYAAEGIKLKILPGGPNLQNVESLLAGGTADIGMTTFMSSTVNAAAQGTKFTILGSFYPTSPAVWMSPPDKPIKTAQDFVGKRIGAPQGRQVQINAIFKVNHLPTGKYTFVPTSFDASPLAKGDVDVQSGYVTSEVVSYKQMTGKAPFTVSYDDVGLPDPSTPFVVTQEFASKHRSLLVGFLRATMRGIQANKADPEEGAKLAAEKYGKGLNLKLNEEIEKNKGYLALQENDVTKKHGLLYIDPTYVAGPVYNGYKASGIKVVPIDQILDMSLQTEAAKGLG